MKNYNSIIIPAIFLLITLFSCIKDDIIEEPILSSGQCSTCPDSLFINSDTIAEVFKIVQEMPTFPGCDSISGQDLRQQCSDEKMLEFVESNLIYPPQAINNGTEGEVIVQFLIEKTGCLNGIKIIRDIGNGCGEELKRIICSMPNWNPGKQVGTPVRVQFNLHYHFKL